MSLTFGVFEDEVVVFNQELEVPFIGADGAIGDEIVEIDQNRNLVDLID